MLGSKCLSSDGASLKQVNQANQVIQVKQVNQVKQVKAHFRVVGGAVDDHVASVVGHRQVVLGEGRLA